MIRTMFLTVLAVVTTAPVLAAGDENADSNSRQPTTLTSVAAPDAPARGAMLPVLYGAYGALQSYDAFSTIRGAGRGAGEANPLMSGVARHPGAVLAVKASVAAATISLSERLWRQGRRKQAIVMMIAANGVMGAVAARNAAVIRGLK
jgi:hypothetical protein